MGRRRGVGTAVLALFALGGCGLLGDNAASRDTLPALPPPGGVAVNKPALPEATGPPPTQPTDTVPATDDADPTSVAVRFLGAVRGGDETTANALSADGREPTNFAWARRTFDDYTAVQGPEAWGSPTCTTDEAGSSATCTWLAGDPNTVLVLTAANGTWTVSHPRSETATADSPRLSDNACVEGDRGVNFRGGPGTEWPRFVQIPPGTCGVIAYERVENSSDGEWRLIEVDGQQGWVVQRVLSGL